MKRNISLIKSVDWLTIGCYLLLVFMGWISIYGASYDFDNVSIFDFNQRAGKQLLWIGCSFFIGIVLLMIDNRFYEVFSYFFYAGAILLLVITIIFAPEIKGSRSWLVIGPVSIQSAELAKFATGLALAKFMSQYNFKLKGLKSYLPVLGLILFPMLLILLQKETGTALVFLAFFLMLYREGMPGLLLFLALCFATLFIVSIRFGDVAIIDQLPINPAFNGNSLGLLFGLIFIVVTQFGFIWVFARDYKLLKILFYGVVATTVLALAINLLIAVDYIYFAYLYLLASSVYLFVFSYQSRKSTYSFIVVFIFAAIAYCYSCDYMFDKILEPHQQTRIKVVLGMIDDPTGSGYNVNQSKIAIGSGQFTGKGFLNGTQTKLKYVPEQDTDFIFCTVAEEFGFVGSVLVLGIYLAFMIRLLVLAERQRKTFSRIYGYCVTSIFFFHFVVNIGMVSGLAPVIGIPLPFFSYGGSSLWGFTILLFIFLRFDAARFEEMR